MRFSGRSELLALIDELVRVDHGRRVQRDVAPPVLILEGVGGSGRSEILRRVSNTWTGETPTVLVDPLRAAEAAKSFRGLLGALTLGLTAELPDFRITFPRVMLARIAMAKTVNEPDPSTERAAMEDRIQENENPDTLLQQLPGALLADAAAVAGLRVEHTAQALADELVRRLRRPGRRARVQWGDALTWFGHQDQGFQHDPLDALVLLSIQAQQRNASVRDDVDHLLMAALLADLRESLARTENRISNAVVLLDNGDASPARAFVRTLLRVRAELGREAGNADPLVVIAASGGDMGMRSVGTWVKWPEREIKGLVVDRIRVEPAVRVVLDGLTANDVQHLARGTIQARSVGSGVIASLVHRLTGGHAEATDKILRRLRTHPGDLDQLDHVLAGDLPEGGALEAHLLGKIVKGLSVRRLADRELRADLITLAAARDIDEARLLVPLLGERAAGRALFVSTTLWADPGPRSSPAMPQFVRFLLLRALAARSRGEETVGPGWCRIYEELLDRARDADDLAGRLHHDLVLGRVAEVVGELTALLRTLPGDRWLGLLDQVVATPALYECHAGEPAPTRRDTPGYTTTRELVTTLWRLSNPLYSHREKLWRDYRSVADGLDQLDRQFKLRCRDRVEQYEDLAEDLL